MPVLALALLVVWAVVAFGLRAFVQWRATGDAGFRTDTGARLSPQWSAHYGFLAALALVAAAPVAAATGTVPAVDSPPVQRVGAAVVATGIAATFAVQLAMGRSWRVGVDQAEVTDLVASGPFALVRNPIFTTMVATAFGFTLLLPSWLSVLATVALVASLEVQVRLVEEPYLRRIHAGAYDHYAERVGRFLPGVGRIPPGSAHRP